MIRIAGGDAKEKNGPPYEKQQRSQDEQVLSPFDICL